MSYYFAPIAAGMGDLLVSLPALQALIKTGIPTYLITRSPMQEGLEDRITGLAGVVREIEFNPQNISSQDVFYNIRNHPLQTDYIWGSEEFERLYPGYKITDVLKGICADFGIAADYEKLTPLPFNQREDSSNRIILVPGSAGLVKCWPYQYWTELANRLAQRGLPVVVVGEPHRSAIVHDCLEAGLKHVPTPALTDALDVISSGRCVVAGDTGLMHMGIQQNIPTVALFRYNVMFMRTYPHVRNFAAPVCPQACRDIEYSFVPNEVTTLKYFEEDAKKGYWETWDCTVENWAERCMASITPEQVDAAICELLQTASVN